MGREGLPQFGFPRLGFALGRTMGLAIVPDHTPQLRITMKYVPSDSIRFSQHGCRGKESARRYRPHMK